MADARQEDKSRHTVEETVRRTGEKTAEQTRRIGESAVESGQQVARVSADLLQQNAETLQNALRFGLDVTTAVMGRSTDQLSRTLGLSGDEVQQATERSSSNATSVLQSTAAVTKGMNGMSREYFALVRHQIESTINRMNELWACRTPQDVAAVQSEFLRETVETAVQSSRRMADMSLKAADDAAKHIARDMERRAA
jgi:phasin family protein